jgi:hypothetical protein
MGISTATSASLDAQTSRKRERANPINRAVYSAKVEQVSYLALLRLGIILGADAKSKSDHKKTASV